MVKEQKLLQKTVLQTIRSSSVGLLQRLLYSSIYFLCICRIFSNFLYLLHHTWKHVNLKGVRAAAGSFITKHCSLNKWTVCRTDTQAHRTTRDEQHMVRMNSLQSTQLMSEPTVWSSSLTTLSGAGGSSWISSESLSSWL